MARLTLPLRLWLTICPNISRAQPFRRPSPRNWFVSYTSNRTYQYRILRVSSAAAHDASAGQLLTFQTASILVDAFQNPGKLFAPTHVSGLGLFLVLTAVVIPNLFHPLLKSPFERNQHLVAFHGRRDFGKALLHPLVPLAGFLVLPLFL